MTSLPIAIRPASEKDVPFFFSATLRANYLLSTINRLIPRDTYYAEHARVLSRVLERSSSRMAIACDAADPDFVYGFALAEPAHGILHFTYVKKSFRRFGIMGQLTSAMGLSLDKAEFSHWTFDLAAVLAHLNKGHVQRRYNPYLLMESPSVQSQRSAG